MSHAIAKAAKPAARMMANRVHRFGPPEVLVYEEIETPDPGPSQVLIRVLAGGVGPWDAWVRAGKSAVPQPLPLIPGSDVAGVVAATGHDVSGLQPGDQVFGVTNARFTGGYAEYAVAEAGMIAVKPPSLGFVEAAAAPVVAVTAAQMLFDHGGLGPGQTVLIHGAGGSVGACAVQLALRAGARVIATTFPSDIDYLQSLGATDVIDASRTAFEEEVRDVDLVLDTIGGAVLDKSLRIVRPGGVLVSSVASPDQELAQKRGIRAVFFLVSVTRDRLSSLADLMARDLLHVRVGAVLPLAQARKAHEMLEGGPRPAGKIVLRHVDPRC
ncbi:MAG: NADP-dependent oxidoreductase [Vicinamibacteria bacterium]